LLICLTFSLSQENQWKTGCSRFLSPAYCRYKKQTQKALRLVPIKKQQQYQCQSVNLIVLLLPIRIEKNNSNRTCASPYPSPNQRTNGIQEGRWAVVIWKLTPESLRMRSTFKFMDSFKVSSNPKVRSCP
jgi:hypothetical protein